MKRKTFFTTQSLDKALNIAAHSKRMSQNQFVNHALCVAIRELGSEEANRWVDSHEANIAANEENHHGN